MGITACLCYDDVGTAMSTVRIPLFPLNVVLFPDQALPLHIFEAGYREMTRHCLESRSPFGLIFVHAGQLSPTGCSARIVKKIKEYEDGRSDILTVGERIFSLIDRYDEKSYDEADVNFLEDDFANIDTSVTADLEILFRSCHQSLYQSAPTAFEGKRGKSFAYYVASELPLDDQFRQGLLEERSEIQRQRLLAMRLATWYPQLQKREQVRVKATGNGHNTL